MIHEASPAIMVLFNIAFTSNTPGKGNLLDKRRHGCSMWVGLSYQGYYATSRRFYGYSDTWLSETPRSVPCRIRSPDNLADQNPPPATLSLGVNLSSTTRTQRPAPLDYFPVGPDYAETGGLNFFTRQG